MCSVTSSWELDGSTWCWMLVGCFIYLLPKIPPTWNNPFFGGALFDLSSLITRIMIIMLLIPINIITTVAVIIVVVAVGVNNIIKPD